MEKKVIYEMSVKKELVTSEMLQSWIDITSEIIDPDSMKISTWGNAYHKYDAQILSEELKGEDIKKDITVQIKSQYEMFNIYDRCDESLLLIRIKVFDRNQDQRVDNLIQDIMCKGLGKLAYKHSSDDIFEQNLEDVALYKLHIGDIKGKKITHHQNMPKWEIIDIECNPGHQHLEAGIWFGAYYCTWFGEDFYQYIPKEKLKAFINCYENVELENGVIRIKLYENMWDYANPVNRNRQWDFRRSVGIDEVAHSLHGRKKTKVTDPVMERLPNDENGNEVIRLYFTSGGENVCRSQADMEITYTHTPDGKLLHEERRKLKNEDSKDDIN